jgi:alpha-galactosidase
MCSQALAKAMIRQEYVPSALAVRYGQKGEEMKMIGVNAVLLAGLVGFCSSALAKPLKVYILAGQSNMEGHAKVEAFDHLAMDPKTVPLLKEMRAADGTPRVCERVWISYFNGREDGEADGFGKLTAGYGSRKDATQDGGKIGPEFTFGIYMQKVLDEPILIIKTAWGGKSLHTDFRSPSAGPYEFNEKELEGLKKKDKDIAQVKADRAKVTGVYYRLMLGHVQRVLKDIKRVCPAYDPKQGYEVAGFVWFQGWNDMVNGGVYHNRGQAGGYDLYSELLAHFIRDVRKDLSAPKMPFVIGVMGAGGPTDKYGSDQQRYKGIHQTFRDAMAAPAALPEFKGNVAAVLTENYWDMELDAVSQKGGQLRAKSRELSKTDMSREEQKAALEKFRAELYAPRDLELLKGITNAGYHYLGSPKIMAQIGKGFSEAMCEMTRK